MTAAYRLFDNKKVTFDSIIEPHAEMTRQRMAAQPVVLLVQDTTEIDVTRPEQQVAGAGPLDGNSRRGAFVARAAWIYARWNTAGNSLGDGMGAWRRAGVCRLASC